MADMAQIQIVSDLVCPWCYVGKRRQDHYTTIFGADRARTIMAGMQQTAATEGLPFKTKLGARSPNTLSVHVLLYWVDEAAGIDQNALAERLFAAHHCDSEDLGNPAVLAQIVGEASMDPAVVEADFRTGRDEARVRALMIEARQAGVSGVPFCIFNRQYAVSGAQPPEVLIGLLDRLSGVGAASAAPASGMTQHAP